MINWPVVIHHKGEDDLFYVSDRREWDIDPDLHYYPYSEGDVLIDCDGKIHSLPYNQEKQRVEISDTGKTLSIIEFQTLVKKHLSFVGQCCTKKVQLKTFSDGIEFVEKTND